MRNLKQLYPAIFLFAACQDTKPLELEIQKRTNENARLVQELTQTKAAFEETKAVNAALQEQIETINSEKDTLQTKLKKQAEQEARLKKSLEKPLEIGSFSIQNQTEKGAILQAKSPFKKSDVRYLSFKSQAVNNKGKIGQQLEGKLYAVYRLGSLVQRMANAGTFTGNDGKNYIYTNAWAVKSGEPIVALDKGIGDKSKGIFEKGKWSVELWFELKNTNKAFKLAENGFVIN
jgi:hypothetical protein